MGRKLHPLMPTNMGRHRQISDNTPLDIQ